MHGIMFDRYQHRSLHRFGLEQKRNWLKLIMDMNHFISKNKNQRHLIDKIIARYSAGSTKRFGNLRVRFEYPQYFEY